MPEEVHTQHWQSADPRSHYISDVPAYQVQSPSDWAHQGLLFTTLRLWRSCGGPYQHLISTYKSTPVTVPVIVMSSQLLSSTRSIVLLSSPTESNVNGIHGLMNDKRSKAQTDTAPRVAHGVASDVRKQPQLLPVVRSGCMRNEQALLEEWYMTIDATAHDKAAKRVVSETSDREKHPRQTHAQKHILYTAAMSSVQKSQSESESLRERQEASVRGYAQYR